VPRACRQAVGTTASTMQNDPKAVVRDRISVRFRKKISERVLSPKFRMLLQDVRNIAAMGNDFHVLSPRDLKAREHKLFGDPVSAKTWRDLGMREDHAIAFPAVFGYRQLAAHLELKAAFRFVVNNRRCSNFLRHLLKWSAFAEFS
jgi:hypothetical protein